MSRQDKQHWDKKWSELAGKPFAPQPLLTTRHTSLPGGKALDIACGLGHNSIWLARHGYQVLGLDISRVALCVALTKARQAHVEDQIVFAQMDLDLWSLPFNAFDLICVFRFLNRRLFPGIRAGLKTGGLLFYSTRHLGLLNRQPGANPEFLLQAGELAEEFSDWEILHYTEGLENAEIIVHKG